MCDVLCIMLFNCSCILLIDSSDLKDDSLTKDFVKDTNDMNTL